jgi:hypothetical protein
MKSHTKILVTVITLLLLNASIAWSSSHHYLIKDPNLRPENKIDQFKHYDFSILFSEKHSLFNIGYIGDNFRRIRIKFVSVIRNPHNQHIYYVYGKSNVLGNICEFQGTIDITEIRLLNPIHYGVDDEYKRKGIKFQGIIIANYTLYENPKQKHSGYFSGKLYSGWYLNKESQIVYDDIESFGDPWCNNQFLGKWKSYSTNQTKVCNWGHGRIPESGDLDKGIGEFWPNEKYWGEGWETLYRAWLEYPESGKTEEARKLEKLEWWK